MNDISEILKHGEHITLECKKVKGGGNSKARNPRIQNLMRMIGFGESIGSVFPSILKVWKEINYASSG